MTGTLRVNSIATCAKLGPIHPKQYWGPLLTELKASAHCWVDAWGLLHGKMDYPHRYVIHTLLFLQNWHISVAPHGGNS